MRNSNERELKSENTEEIEKHIKERQREREKDKGRKADRVRVESRRKTRK